MKLRRWLLVLIMLLLCLVGGPNAQAKAPIRIQLDGVTLNSDVSP